MATVMKCFGDALGRATGHYGQYLKSMDFEANGGHGLIVTTPDIEAAMRFADNAEAFAFYHRSPACHPTRSSDGRPNRPLTALNWSFFDPARVAPESLP